MYIVMGAEPASGISVKDVRERFGDCMRMTEAELAEAFALAHNQFWWVEDDIYDFEEGTPEYESAESVMQAWGALAKEYGNHIFNIQKKAGNVKPEEKGYEAIKSFMLCNGFIDGDGWWIKEKH